MRDLAQISKIKGGQLAENMIKLGKNSYGEERKSMGFADPVDYVVVSFEGDYAMLQKVDEPNGELTQVAIALLPDGATDGSRVRRVMLEYTLLP